MCFITLKYKQKTDTHDTQHALMCFITLTHKQKLTHMTHKMD